MSKRFRVSTPAWSLLILVPLVLIAVAIWPKFGQYGEGLLPEVLAPDQTSSESFPEVAAGLRLWCGVTLAVACLAGIAWWFSLRSRWRRRLRSFDPGRVLGYRGLVWGIRFLGALLCGALLGLTLMLLSGPVRKLSAATWVVFVADCALAAALQYVTMVFGRSETRRLYFGR